MIKILLVDDEVLAMEYLQNLIDWEKYGFCIAGCASSGKRALELYKVHRPQIVISDIKMIGMDGLELAMRLKRVNSNIVVILLSAYKDFDYAKQGIQYGVDSYLIKHELNEMMLLEELAKVKELLIKNDKKEKIYQKYFMNQLIYNADIDNLDCSNLSNRVFLIMLHRNYFFENGVFIELPLNVDEMESVQAVIEDTLYQTIFYVADVKITSNNWMVLYRIENEVSKYKVNALIEEKSKQICDTLKKHTGSGINLLYTNEIRPDEISSAFQKMSRQIRKSMFWKRDTVYSLNRLNEVKAEEMIVWTAEIAELESAVYEENQEFEHRIRYLFELVSGPKDKLESCKELIQLLERTIAGIEKREGIQRKMYRDKIFKLQEIQSYYIDCYIDMHSKIHENTSKRYSNLVLEMMRFIRKNYKKEMNLELMGSVFQMNGVYLGQVFKKEVGVTFLKFLTGYRIDEAKKLLESGNYNISEVTEAVGYKTSQYFSQIFMKNVGMKPQEYKKWNEKR